MTTLVVVLTRDPAGQMADTVGTPAETFKVTGTVILLFEAVVEATTIFALYAPGAKPTGSTEISTELGSPTSAIFPVGVAFNHVPPDSVILAESAPPTLIT